MYLAKCGHETKESDTVSAFNDSTVTKITIVNCTTEYCHKCLEKMAIKCAWCGGTIFIGDSVTLYSPVNKDFQVPSHAIVFNKDPLQLVGCHRRNCADSGADYAGVWIPPGMVLKHPSMIEIALANPGCAVIRNDLNGKIDIKIIKPN